MPLLGIGLPFPWNSSKLIIKALMAQYIKSQELNHFETRHVFAFFCFHQLSLLHKAVLRGDRNEVKHLVKEGADISIKDSQLGVSV